MSQKEVLFLKMSKGKVRLTPTRAKVIQVLEASSAPLTAEEIWQKVSQSCPSVGRATVYRTLKLLEEKHLLQKMHLGKKCHGYFLFQRESCPFVCQQCRQIFTVSSKGIESTIKQLEKSTGFTVKNYIFQLSGICFECSNKGENP